MLYWGFLVLKRSEEYLKRIIEELKKGDWVSGEILAEKLKISRTQVWKNINRLKSLGYSIKGLRRSGYLLYSSPDIPYPWELKPFGRFKNFIYFESINSTNTYLFSLAKEGAEEGTVLIANSQTEGRGRYGRRWFSSKGNIFMSFLLKPGCPAENGGFITLLSGLACARSIEKSGIKITLKWPNDLLIASKKAGGILCESAVENGIISFVVVGIGINIHLPKKRNELIEHATSLAENGFKGRRIDLIQKIIEEFEVLYEKFLRGDTRFIINEYKKRTLPYGEMITVKTGERIIRGKFAGIENDGSLLIMNGERVNRIYTGEVLQ
jgi:BirA family biotin operon repressor/biotin-[acetyl-CoA-carboxylase] ligase